MKTHRNPIAVSTLALSAALVASPAHATGTAANTLIQNTASATYSSGGTSTTVTSNTVDIRVDQLLDVATAGLNSAPVVAGATSATLSYSVTNTGNGADSFTLSVNPAVSGNAFDGVIQTIAIDNNGNGVFDAGDTVVTNGGTSPVTAPDGSFKVVVVLSLPSGVTDTQTSQVRLTATSAIGSGTPGTVFTGAGTGGVDAVVGSSNATSNALDSIVASLAVVSLTKSATIADQFGGTTPVPGATVTYSIVSHLSGTGSAQGVHVTDAFPAGTTYVPGSLKLGSTSLTDTGADSDGGLATATGVDVTLGDLASGSADQTVSFQVKIN